METQPLLPKYETGDTANFRKFDGWSYLLFFALGMGPSFNLPNAICLELPWLERTQPEGVGLAAWMGLGSTIAAGASLLIGFYSGVDVRGTTIAGVLILVNFALMLLVAFTWQLTIGGISVSIFVGTLGGATIGNLYFMILVPWVAATFPQAYTSSFISGNSFTTFMSVMLQLIQSPGDHPRFSPTVYFMVLALPIIISFVSLFYVVQKFAKARKPSIIAAEIQRESIFNQRILNKGLKYAVVNILSSALS